MYLGHLGDNFSGGSVQVNIGCGATPTDGWINLDNSWVVRMARWPLVLQLLSSTRILPTNSREFAKVANHKRIRFANASLRIPFASNSVEVIYSSHMIEHLDRREAGAFLLEVRRVLRSGGIIRLAAPDLARLVRNYVTTGDANQFIAGTRMGQLRPIGIFPRLRAALIGPRHHLWMYDGRSLAVLLRDAEFTSVRIMSPGMTNIADPGALNLAERADESVYVEAVRP